MAPRLAYPLLVLAALATASAAPPDSSPGRPPAGSLAEIEARGVAAVEPTPALARPHVVLAAGTVYTMDGAVLAPGWVELVDGKVAAVGAGEPPARDGARVIRAPGGAVTPGLIDTHSHLGVYPSPGARAHSDGNEATAPVTAGVWAEHSTWPQDPGFQRAAEGGVTAMQILPGSANLIGGRGVTLQNLPARGPRAMRFPGAPETVKLACGENPKRVYSGRGPSTRMGNLHGQRTAFAEAEAYLRKWTDHEAKAKAAADGLASWEAENGARVASGRKPRSPKPEPAPEPPARDLSKETLAGILSGAILPQIHCYRADDMLSMLQVADEFGFRVRSFHHAVEAYKIRDVLAARDVSVSTWADWWGFKLEAFDSAMAGAAMLHAAGARAVIHSDSPIGIQRLNQEAAKALRAGRQAGLQLTELDALSWITTNAAWTLGIDDRTGRLAPGLRADVVLWDGPPLSVYARPTHVFVDGVPVVDLERPAVWSDFSIGREVAP
jgi:imidazolonepropionase-like amidohydrolase